MTMFDDDFQTFFSYLSLNIIFFKDNIRDFFPVEPHHDEYYIFGDLVLLYSYREHVIRTGCGYRVGRQDPSSSSKDVGWHCAEVCPLLHSEKTSSAHQVVFELLWTKFKWLWEQYTYSCGPAVPSSVGFQGELLCQHPSPML